MVIKDNIRKVATDIGSGKFASNYVGIMNGFLGKMITGDEANAAINV
jgi:hypothetical protein